MMRVLSIATIAIAAACAIPVTACLFGWWGASCLLVVAFHLLGALLCSAGFFFLTRDADLGGRPANLWWFYALASSSLIPVVGVLQIVLIFAIQRRAKHPPPVVSDEITVPDAEVFARPLARTRQLEILERLDIEPFVDIFRRGQSELKKSAIRFLSAIPSAQSMEMLSRALLDEDVEVRLYAAGVIGLIDDRFMQEIDTGIARQEAHPGDPATALALADLFLSYAESGLLDEVVRGYYNREAIRVLAGLPLDREVAFRLARAHVALGEYEEARRVLEGEPGGPPRGVDGRRLLCDIFFALRDYDAVAGEVRRMRDEGLLPPDDPLGYFGEEHATCIPHHHDGCDREG